MKKCKENDAPLMAGCRSRNKGNKKLRQKRGDTLVGTIEEIYGVDLGYRSDMKLETLRKVTGKNGLKNIIEKLT